MLDIREYCDRVNGEKTSELQEIFESVRDRLSLPPNKYHSAEDLAGDALNFYNQEVKYHFNNYKNIWKDIVQKYLKYEKPNLVNAGFKEYLDRKDYPLYIFPTFMSCGR